MTYLTEGEWKTNIKEGKSKKGGINHNIVLQRPPPPKGMNEKCQPNQK